MLLRSSLTVLSAYVALKNIYVEGWKTSKGNDEKMLQLIIHGSKIERVATHSY